MARSLAIHLDVRLEGALPTGRAYDDAGASRDFTGWVDLVAAIDELLADVFSAEDAAEGRRPDDLGAARPRREGMPECRQRTEGERCDA